MDPRRHVHASSVEAGGVGILADAQGAGADDDEFHLLAQRRTQLHPEAKAQPRPAPKVVQF
ncbi:hypothetical protein MNAN1_001863 [Malassezia nana]|uniref:Uncharacterized protein n=1 Tax=Malassezia nana TaxID=180528 RepID=A0AAF0J2F7_9BASI|nr:hypothetical protein MNAN1_001863 [Malassezia nana]